MTHPASPTTDPCRGRVDVWVQPVASPGARADRQPSRAEAMDGVLRTALAHYFGPGGPRYPGDLEPSGDGRFTLGGPDDPLRITTATTESAVMAAFSRHAELGLHGAALARPVRWQILAERYLTVAELSILLSVPPGQARRRFLQLWSLKCACASAGKDPLLTRTEGLQLRINRAGCISIKVVDDAAVPDGPDFSTDWSLAQFELSGGLLVSGCIRLPAVVANTFRFLRAEPDGQTSLLQPTAYLRSQPRYTAFGGLPGRA